MLTLKKTFRIVIGDVPVSYWPIFFLSPVTVPEVFAKGNSAQFPVSSLTCSLHGVKGGRYKTYKGRTCGRKPTTYTLTQWVSNKWRIKQIQNTITANQQPLIELVSKGQLVFVFASGRKTEAVIFHVSLSPASFNMNSFFFYRKNDGKCSLLA